MSKINNTQSINYEIDRQLWQNCEICGKDIKTIKTEIGGSNEYFSRAFNKHLKEHSIDLTTYFYEKIKIPKIKCPCGICDQNLNITYKGAKIVYRKMSCGRNDGIKIWSEQAKISRKGSGNPMFGKTAWNKNLDISHPTIKKISEKRKGIKVSQETKKRQSESAKKRLIHGHTGFKHSEENKKKFRENTLNMIKEGKFKQNKSKPFLLFREILIELNSKFEEEYIIWPFTFDFKVDEILFEIDGDYFHSNPKIYPNGPQTKTQKINSANDQRKNIFCKNKSIKLIRFWECDIINNKEEIKCKVKKLLELN